MINFYSIKRFDGPDLQLAEGGDDTGVIRFRVIGRNFSSLEKTLLSNNLA